MTVVSNTSPLIILAKAGLLHVLPQLFTRISIPLAVHDEIFAGGESDPRKNALPNCEWLQVVKLDPPAAGFALRKLGRGEAEAIELAHRTNSSCLIVDDRAARQVAHGLNLSVSGTLSILARASRAHLIPSFTQAVSKVRQAGLFVADEIVETVELELKKGESK